MTDLSPCRCGHTADAHQHYRPGTDCGHASCTCTAYRPKAAHMTTPRWIALGAGLVLVGLLLGLLIAAPRTHTQRPSPPATSPASPTATTPTPAAQPPRPT